MDTVRQGEVMVCGAKDQTVGIQIDRGNVLDKVAELPQPQCLGTGAEAVTGLLVKALSPEPFIPRGSRTTAVENAHQADLVLGDLPSAFRPVKITELEDGAIFFVQRHLLLDLIGLHGQQMGKIQFVTQTAKEGHISPGT